MPRFKIEFKRSAEREFGRLPRTMMERFAMAFDDLRDDPMKRRPGVDVKRLHGTKNTWRLRIGDYRGIYELEGDKLIFTRFGRRGNVYSV